MSGVGPDGSWKEAVALAVVGGALARWAARRTGLPEGPATALAAIASANGVISGRRGVYDWMEPEGAAALALDSTWSVTNTFAGLALHAASAVRGDPDYLPELSRRRNRHVYGGGFAVKRGFALTQGNVITNVRRDGLDLSGDELAELRRRLLVERHEDLHVWQARWFGPLYAPLYVGWMAVGLVRGTLRWFRRRDRSWFEHVEVAAYYQNPFERWAYAVDQRWPHPQVRRVLGPSA